MCCTGIISRPLYWSRRAALSRPLAERSSGEAYSSWPAAGTLKASAQCHLARPGALRLLVARWRLPTHFAKLRLVTKCGQ